MCKQEVLTACRPSSLVMEKELFLMSVVNYCISSELYQETHVIKEFLVKYMTGFMHKFLKNWPLLPHVFSCGKLKTETKISFVDTFSSDMC